MKTSDRQLRAVTVTDKATELAVTKLNECLEKDHLLNVFDKDEPEMDHAIINALKKGSEYYLI